MEQIGKNHEEARKYISAEDVNRFCYCPYQYYYSLTVNKIPRERKKFLKGLKREKIS